jgi:alpha-1,2-mannosyltransferase
MPYTVAMCIWEVSTLLLYLLAIAAIVREYQAAYAPIHCVVNWSVLALAYPAVFINLIHGNNAFLTTALMAGGLLLLNRRPVLAGALIGLLCYKPQYGVLFPFVLAASGRWRAFGSAAATVVVLTIGTIVLYPEAWHAFLATASGTRTEILDGGGPGLHKIQSVFAWARMWVTPLPLAYALQGAASIAIAAAVTWLWRSNAAYPLKAAALTIGAILITPYSLDYDLVVAAPALAWVALYGLERGFAPFEATALAALWLSPLVARQFAEMTTIPLAVIALLFVFILVLQRAKADFACCDELAFALRQ